MDASAYVIVPIVAVAAWFSGPPLLLIGEGFLARVDAAAAAPSAVAVTEAAMPLAITKWWRTAFRCMLVVCSTLALLRLFTLAPPHQPALLSAFVLINCVVALALVAVVDGSAHFVFVEMLMPALLLVLLSGVVHQVVLNLVVGSVGAGIIMLGIYGLGRVWYGEGALGFGDVQLAFVFGALVGWPGILGALLYSMLAVGVTSCILLVARRITLQTYIPYGTFLACGVFLQILLHPPIWL